VKRLLLALIVVALIFGHAWLVMTLVYPTPENPVNESNTHGRGLRYWTKGRTPLWYDKYRCDFEQNRAEFIEMGEYERVHKQGIGFFVEFEIKNVGECVWFLETTVIFGSGMNHNYFEYAYVKPAHFDEIVYPNEIGTGTLEVLILHRDFREISGIPFQVQFEMRGYRTTKEMYGSTIDWFDSDGNKIWGNIFEGLETQPMYLEFYVLEEE